MFICVGFFSAFETSKAMSEWKWNIPYSAWNRESDCACWIRY